MKKKKIIFCFIFARGGSKGIKNKNLVKLNGKPLLFYSISLAKKIKNITKIFVSTDSKAIAQYAKKNKAYVINRPKKLSRDSSYEIDAWKHAIQFLKKKKIFFNTFLSLPTTSPLRNKIDVINSLKMLKKGTDIVLTGTRSKRNPWFNMAIKKKNGFYKIVNSARKAIYNRQAAPKVIDLTTVAYAADVSYILKAKNYFDGNVKVNLIPSLRAVDIDDKDDLNYAKYLFKTKNKKR
jgi:N-acylneuraminate cytidylyltransferase